MQPTFAREKGVGTLTHAVAADREQVGPAGISGGSTYLVRDNFMLRIERSSAVVDGIGTRRGAGNVADCRD